MAAVTRLILGFSLRPAADCQYFDAKAAIQYSRKATAFTTFHRRARHAIPTACSKRRVKKTLSRQDVAHATSFVITGAILRHGKCRAGRRLPRCNATA